MKTSVWARTLCCLGSFLVAAPSLQADLLTFVTDIRRCAASYSGNGSATTTESRRVPFGPFDAGADISCTNGLETWTSNATQLSSMDSASVSFAGTGNALIVASPLSAPLQALGQSKLDIFFTIDAAAAFVLHGHVHRLGHAQATACVTLSRFNDENTTIESITSENPGRLMFNRVGTLQPGMYRLQAEATALCRTAAPELGAVSETSCSLEFRIEAPPCPADWNADGRADSTDLFDFLRDFFGPGADFDGDGQSNSIDLFEFLSLLLSGC